MSRSRLVRALALSVALASSCHGLVLAGNCDKGCDGTQDCKCQCASAPGLLDSLNALAAKLPKQSRSRVSILSTLTLKFGQQNSCDEPACGADPGCGAEPTCGSEPTCGAEPSCGIEPGCGVEPGCGCAAPSYSHANGPIAYPSQLSNPSSTGQSHQHLHQKPVQPHAAPPAPNAIPTPILQDSTVDPFRDDAVSHLRSVPARSASQRISSHATRPVPPRVLEFDPQARARGNDGEASRSLAKRAALAGSKQHVSDAEEIVVSRLPKFVTVERRSTQDQVSSEQDSTTRKRKSLNEEVSPRDNRSSRVVSASASEPARLSPLKSSNVEFDLSSSRNPLRDK